MSFFLVFSVFHGSFELQQAQSSTWYFFISVLTVAVALHPDIQVNWGSTAVCVTTIRNQETVCDCSHQRPLLTSVPPPSSVPADTTFYTLDYHAISSISQADFQGLISVKILHLSFGQITSLPADVFSEMPSLEKLYLDYNAISTVDPDAFRGIPMLHTFSWVGNQMGRFPAPIFTHSSNLEELYLTDEGGS